MSTTRRADVIIVIRYIRTQNSIEAEKLTKHVTKKKEKKVDMIQPTKQKL